LRYSHQNASVPTSKLHVHTAFALRILHPAYIIDTEPKRPLSRRKLEAIKALIRAMFDPIR
jgi:hypothetical protein